MSSLATSPLTTIAALKAADRILGADRIWNGTSDDQQRWLAQTFVPGVVDLTRVPEIEAHATHDIAEHIAFLAKHGWQAQFTDPLTGGAIATAAVLDVLVEWLETSKSYPITGRDRNVYSGFKIERKNGLRMFKHLGLDTILFQLATKTSDLVFIIEAPRAPTGVQDLLGLVDVMLDTQQIVSPFDAPGAAFPKVDLQSKQSLDWLPGIHTVAEDGRPAVIEQAVQQATLKMNETGARARAADEMVVRRGFSLDNTVIVDQPFLFAIVRSGVTKPIFAAYVDYDSWKDPGSLGR